MWGEGAEGRGWRENHGAGEGVGLTEEDTGNDDDFFLETGLETLVSVDAYGSTSEYTR